jgi:hypothetical protein
MNCHPERRDEARSAPCPESKDPYVWHEAWLFVGSQHFHSGVAMTAGILRLRFRPLCANETSLRMTEENLDQGVDTDYTEATSSGLR